jgi:hypothetical protein
VGGREKGEGAITVFSCTCSLHQPTAGRAAKRSQARPATATFWQARLLTIQRGSTLYAHASNSLLDICHAINTHHTPATMFARRPACIKALPINSTTIVHTQLRCLHAKIAAKNIPKPTPFVPDATTFLTLIGRKMSAHAQKIPDWNALFSLSSPQLRELGVEPARSRRYLLHWRNKFRQGEFGIGGDLTDVQDGVGELRIVEVPAANAPATLTSSPGMRKIVVNVPAGQDAPKLPLDKLVPVQGTKVVRSNLIGGSYVEAIKEKPGAAKIVAKEGLWEIKRGHKIDGGERRKAEVRNKRRIEEKKTSRA